MPQKISIDMGVTDILIYNAGRRIVYSGKGGDTDVGITLPDPNVGMSVPAVDIDMETIFPGITASRRTGKSRVTSKKKKQTRIGRSEDFPTVTNVRW